jgi:hypothetical protein
MTHDIAQIGSRADDSNMQKVIGFKENNHLKKNKKRVHLLFFLLSLMKTIFNARHGKGIIYIGLMKDFLWLPFSLLINRSKDIFHVYRKISSNNANLTRRYLVDLVSKAKKQHIS